jgi:stage 0 sporulation regulatory protein
LYQETQALLDEIKSLKLKLYDSVRKNGLTAEQTIKYSQELDQVIYQYQQLTLKNRKQSVAKSSVLQQMMCILPTIFAEV